MNILVMTTGGTIGSSFDGASVNVNRDSSTPVIGMYERTYHDARFEVTSPLNILSESVTAEDLSILWQALYQTDFSRYDGVILTCGSDTLAYLSSFVGLLFPHRPIALVCANKILTAPDSNGYENFCAAVTMLKKGFSEVFVPYRNADGVMYIHSATEIRQASYSDDFFSLYQPYATLSQRLGVLSDFTCHTLKEGCFDAVHPLRIRERVLMIAPYPMLSYEDMALSRYKAALHLTYHSATLDSDHAKALMENRGETPVFLAPLKKGAKLYRTTADMLASGMIPLYDITPECAYMKLLLAVNQERYPLRELMEEA